MLYVTNVGMLTQRLFAHVYKKHKLSIQDYATTYNIDLYKYQSQGGYYKNGISRRNTRHCQRKQKGYRKQPT